MAQALRAAGYAVEALLGPEATRSAIEASAGRKPPVIVWVNDPVDNFFLQVQGSGRVLLTDGPDSGKTIRVAYADHNGQPYVSIGRWLADRGELSADQANVKLSLLPLTKDRVAQFRADFPGGVPVYDFKAYSRTYNPDAATAVFEMQYSK